MKEGTKFLLQNGILLLVVFLLFFGSMEILLRLFFPQETNPLFLPTGDRETFAEYDSLLGWKMIPNATGDFFSREFSTDIKINNQGFRDDDFPFEKALGKKRIAIIGDSYAWGFGVEENETFSTILEQKLGEGYEVLNFGVSGYGTDQYYLLLNSTVFAYHPDIILITFHPNDVENTGNAEAYDYPKPLFILRNESLILTNVPVPQKETWDSRHFSLLQKINFFFSRYSHAWIFMKKHVKSIISSYTNYTHKNNVHSSDGFVMYKKEYAGEYLYYQQLQAALYKEIAMLAAEKKTILVVLYIPPKESINEDDFFAAVESAGVDPNLYDNNKPEQLIQEIAAENNISFIDLTEPFQNKTEYYFIRDPHWTKEGHAAAAEVIYQSIQNIIPNINKA